MATARAAAQSPGRACSARRRAARPGRGSAPPCGPRQEPSVNRHTDCAGPPRTRPRPATPASPGGRQPTARTPASRTGRRATPTRAPAPRRRCRRRRSSRRGTAADSRASCRGWPRRAPATRAAFPVRNRPQNVARAGDGSGRRQAGHRADGRQDEDQPLGPRQAAGRRPGEEAEVVVPRVHVVGRVDAALQVGRARRASGPRMSPGRVRNDE